jgi:hypothetical protein
MPKLLMVWTLPLLLLRELAAVSSPIMAMEVSCTSPKVFWRGISALAQTRLSRDIMAEQGEMIRNSRLLATVLYDAACANWWMELNDTYEAVLG